MVWNGLINEYRDYLPVDDSTPVVSLNEEYPVNSC